MKNNLQNFLSMVFVWCSLAGVSQPTLDSSNMCPHLGEIFTVVTSTDPVNPGTSGANQTWNFSSWPNHGVVTSTVMNKESTQQCNVPPFANANIAMLSNAYPQYSYSQFSSSGRLYWGNCSVATWGVGYYDPETLMNYPCYLGSNTNDNWSSSFSPTINHHFSRTGVTTTTADAYGTLTTPVGTYTNCLRIHMVQTHTEVYTEFGQIPTTSTVNYDSYVWYQAGVHNQICSTSTMTTLSQGTVSTQFAAEYLQSVTIGIDETQGFAGNLQLFPNPVSDDLKLNLTVKGNCIIDLDICDINGKQVKQIDKLNFFQGNNKIDISTNELPAGVYLLNVSMDGMLQKKEKFVVLR